MRISLLLDKHRFFGYYLINPIKGVSGIARNRTATDHAWKSPMQLWLAPLQIYGLHWPERTWRIRPAKSQEQIRLHLHCTRLSAPVLPQPLLQMQHHYLLPTQHQPMPKMQVVHLHQLWRLPVRRTRTNTPWRRHRPMSFTPPPIHR